METYTQQHSCAEDAGLKLCSTWRLRFTEDVEKHVKHVYLNILCCEGGTGERGRERGGGGGGGGGDRRERKGEGEGIRDRGVVGR